MKMDSCEVGLLDSDDSEDDERIEFKMLRYHAQRVESDINRHLFQRIINDPLFSMMKNIEDELLKLCKQEFNDNFTNKQGLL